MKYDLVIQHGRVFDGLGNSSYADIGVKDGRVCKIASSIKEDSGQTIDATGLWVTPGLVDIHTHYDLEVELAPGLSESVRHGVTSLVMGGCSLSVTYGQPQDLANIFARVETLSPELIEQWLSKAKIWSSPAAYIQHLEELALGPNIASMLGHSALRVKVMGLERSLTAHATKKELAIMRQLAEEALDAGCIGISIDMVHWHKVSGKFAGLALPSHHAAFKEYRMLADVCRARDAVFQVTPNPKNFFSIFNIFRLSPGLFRAPLRNTILAALDLDGAPLAWRMFPLILFICNKLLGCNIRFQTLAEPFTIYGDGHITPLFEEFSAGVKLNNTQTREERQDLWQDHQFRQEFVRSWKAGYVRTFHRDLYRMYIVSLPGDGPENNLVGKSIGQAADEIGTEPIIYFMTLLEEHDTDFRWVTTGANRRPSVRKKLMKHEYILPGFSDAGAHSRNLAFFDNSLSVLRQAQQTEFITAERAVSRVTGEPARWFNLDAGTIKEGSQADILLLDPEKLACPIPTPVPIEDSVFSGATRLVKRDLDPAVRHLYKQGVEVVRAGEVLPLLGQKKLGCVLKQLNPTSSKEASLARFRNQITEKKSLASPVCYWDIFLLKHQNPFNVFFHCIAFILMYSVLLAAVSLQNMWIMLLGPLSQTLGFFGHFLFERNKIDQRDALFSWRAFISLHKMFLMVMLRRYWGEVERVRREYAQFQV